MDQIYETASLCSNSSLSSTGNIESIDRMPNFYLINPNDSILNSRYESIVSKQLTNFSQNDIKISSIRIHYKRLHDFIQKFEQSRPEKELLFKMEHVVLTDNDRFSGIENEELLNSEENISKQFEMTFGTTINDYMPEDIKPYLEFDLSIDQQRERLSEWRIKHSFKDIEFKRTLTDNIEQQEKLNSFRVSRRQRKKSMAIEKKKSLANWFNISRVEEVTKDQEKDLLALKMRRVWNPKQFYKRSSGQNSNSDKDQFFEIGTIQENPSDFYSGRLVKRERKQTMLDELMADAQLQAFNKRKINTVMSKNSRIKRLQARKFKRKLRKQREEKANRFERMRPSPHQRANIFKTFEL